MSRSIVLFDHPSIRAFIELLSHLIPIPFCILDPSGSPVFESEPSAVCSEFHHQTPVLATACNQIRQDIHTACQLSTGPFFRTCSCGLMIGATPIVINAHNTATLIVHSFLCEPLDKRAYDRFREKAQRFSFDEIPYLQALMQVPVTSESKVFQILELFARFAAQLISSAPDPAPPEEPVGKLDKDAKFWEKVIEGIPAPMFIKTHEGLYKSCNQAFRTLVGRPQETIVGQTVFDIMPPDKAEIHHQVDQLLRAKSGNQMYEATMTDTNGRQRHFLFSKAAVNGTDNSLCGFVGLMLDITDLKQTEEALRRSEIRFRELIEQLPEALLVVSPKGQTRFMNKAAEAFFEESRDQFTGIRLGLPLEIPEPAEIEVIIGKEKSKYAEVRTVHSQWEGKPAIIVSLRETTEQYHSRIHQQQLEMQLQQSQKMESIGVLASGIAHDFNNILSAILGYGELAKEEVCNLQSHGEYLQQIIIAGLRAKELTSQILTFSRQAPQEVNRIEVASMVKEVCKLLRATLPANITIKTQLDDHIAVMADATQLHQVLMNLCTNAWHAMQESGGTLTIALRRSTIDETFASHHPGLLPDNYICLSVQDTGEGMSEHVRSRIFDPFFTTKKKQQGTGMGLAVVHGIVKGHGGTIAVETELGKGTRFDVYLPEVKCNECGVNLSDTSDPTINGNESVLFVDDEVPIIQLSKAILERLGYQVTTCQDGKEALALFEAKPDKFDILITDMAMPGMTGLRLASEIRRLRPDIPVVLCTGFSNRLEGQTPDELNVDEVLCKPVVKSQMGRTIRNLLDKAQWN